MNTKRMQKDTENDQSFGVGFRKQNESLVDVSGKKRMTTPKGLSGTISKHNFLASESRNMSPYISVKGSVPLRPDEKIRKIRKFESQNFVHCLVSMCSSMF